MKRLSILGSTGSIGQNALRLVDMFPERFRVIGLAARSNAEMLAEQALKYRPEIVALHDSSGLGLLKERLPGVPLACGTPGIVECAVHPSADTVVAAISGAAGLIPTFRAILAGKRIALANKETLVIAGELVMSSVRLGRVELLPIDSEHSALHQCLRGSHRQDVSRLLLTASGGPFFGWTRTELESATVETALKHPTWRMGRKITVDSATLMNKGLEVIEAHHLFGFSPKQIGVVIHPQSRVHSMVEFIDGTVLAQMGITDMRSAILYALTYPERWPSTLPRLDFAALGQLEFHPPDMEAFPCLPMAYAALEKGRTFPAALNAANEVAVEAFLKGRLAFNAIPAVIEEVLARHEGLDSRDLESILEADQVSRGAAKEALKSRAL